MYMDPFQCDGEGGAELVASGAAPPADTAGLQVTGWHPLAQAELHQLWRWQGASWELQQAQTQQKVLVGLEQRCREVAWA